LFTGTVLAPFAAYFLSQESSIWRLNFQTFSGSSGTKRPLLHVSSPTRPLCWHPRRCMADSEGGAMVFFH